MCFHCIGAYCDRDFHAAVNTNNGTEALNKVLKYNYLPHNKNMTLSAAVTLIVEKFLPDSYQKYLFMNYKQSDMYRTYKSFVPILPSRKTPVCYFTLLREAF